MTTRPVRTLCALLFVLPLATPAQQTQPAPDWTLSGPATTASPSAIPLQRQRRALPMTPGATRQPLPPAAAGEGHMASDEVGSAVPEGYRVMPVPAAPGNRADDVQRSHLGEDQLTQERQIALLRKRVAALIQQMDDVTARLVAGEQALASHRHSYSIPNVGEVSVESYESFLARSKRDGQPVPFMSGGSLTRTTTTPVVPR